MLFLVGILDLPFFRMENVSVISVAKLNANGLVRRLVPMDGPLYLMPSTGKIQTSTVGIVVLKLNLPMLETP